MSKKQTDYDSARDGVERAAILIWARARIYPPPYAGDPFIPRIVQFALAAADLWSDPRSRASGAQRHFFQTRRRSPRSSAQRSSSKRPCISGPKRHELAA